MDHAMRQAAAAAGAERENKAGLRAAAIAAGIGSRDSHERGRCLASVMACGGMTVVVGDGGQDGFWTLGQVLGCHPVGLLYRHYLILCNSHLHDASC
jgi:hypothetical protein